MARREPTILTALGTGVIGHDARDNDPEWVAGASGRRAVRWAGGSPAAWRCKVRLPPTQKLRWQNSGAAGAPMTISASAEADGK